MTRQEQIVKGMASWFEERRTAPTVKARNDYQRGWDHAICAAAEYLRRRDDWDETLGLELMTLLMSTKDKS